MSHGADEKTLPLNEELSARNAEQNSAPGDQTN